MDINILNKNLKTKTQEHWIPEDKNEENILNIIDNNYDTFNWQLYLQNYEDLCSAGINTKKDAWNHWINCGIQEGRKSNIISILGFDLNIFRKFNNEYINLSEEASINMCRNLDKIQIFSFNSFYNIYYGFNMEIYKIFNNINHDNEVEIIYNFHITQCKDTIIHSLKTFYNNYPKFDYHLHRKVNKIENIGEVDTIINWFKNGCDYSFLNNSIEEYSKKNIVIY